MKICPFCAEQIQDEAIKCRYCGEFLDGRQRPGRPPFVGYRGFYWSYEYRSQTDLFGWPLAHVAQGVNPETGLPRVAKGIIALGNVAIGVVAVGGVAAGGLAVGGLGLGLLVLGGIAVGGLAVGGLGLGLLVLGGIAVGGVALGGIALALYLAVGGITLSRIYGIRMVYAIGALALAPHAIGAMDADPEFVRLFTKWWPGIIEE